MEYKNVRLDKLNFTSTPVRLGRSGKYMDQLKSSLEATEGPIDPIIVRDLGGSEYVVVAGESRVQALCELGYARWRFNFVGEETIAKHFLSSAHQDSNQDTH